MTEDWRTHRAVVTAAVRAPLEVIQVKTVGPDKGEVIVKVEYVASTPLDSHQVSSPSSSEGQQDLEYKERWRPSRQAPAGTWRWNCR